MSSPGGPDRTAASSFCTTLPRSGLARVEDYLRQNGLSYTLKEGEPGSPLVEICVQSLETLESLQDLVAIEAAIGSLQAGPGGHQRDRKSGIGYVRAKASEYVRIGPAAYRAQDALARPAADLPAEALAAIGRGMRQLADGYGAADHQPLRELGVFHVTDLIETLHFEAVHRETVAMDGGIAILDKMECRHTMSGLRVVLFNLVDAAPQAQPT